MSILMIVGGGEAESAAAERLLAQGDEVRVVVAEAGEKPGWVALGVHVAVGDATDHDLIERAGQGARSLVIFDDRASDAPTLDAALTGALGAGIDRLILCAPDVTEETRRTMARVDPSYVILTYGRRFSLRGRTPVALIAEAVDAADDLGGSPRLEVDLREPDALTRLDPAHGA